MEQLWSRAVVKSFERPGLCCPCVLGEANLSGTS